MEFFKDVPVLFIDLDNGIDKIAYEMCRMLHELGVNSCTGPAKQRLDSKDPKRYIYILHTYRIEADLE